MITGLTKKKHLKKAVIEHEKDLGAQRAEEHLAAVEDQKQRHAVRSDQHDAFLDKHDIAADAEPLGMTPEPESEATDTFEDEGTLSPSEANGAKGAKGAKDKKGKKGKGKKGKGSEREVDFEANPLAGGTFEDEG